VFHWRGRVLSINLVPGTILPCFPFYRDHRLSTGTLAFWGKCGVYKIWLALHYWTSKNHMCECIVWYLKRSSCWGYTCFIAGRLLDCCCSAAYKQTLVISFTCEPLKFSFQFGDHSASKAELPFLIDCFDYSILHVMYIFYVRFLNITPYIYKC
jgi:hypothetical protein